MIREFLKLARSFNAVLTGVSPVMGAIVMQEYNLLFLFILFIIGFFGHSFGFILNDILDFKIDKHSSEISDRPLISGSISLKSAWIYAIISLIIPFIIALYISYSENNYFSIIILIFSAVFIIIYDLTSKKLPFMDIFVSLAIFLFILYGVSTQVTSFSEIPLIAWLVCILGAIQVLYMQIIAGGLKDIENDYKKGAKTGAIKLGVRVNNNLLYVSTLFKIVAFGIQIINIILVFLPFFYLAQFQTYTTLTYFQWFILVLISLLMLYLSYRLLHMGTFVRKNARKLIGSHYMIHFCLVPIMLMTFNLWIGLLVFFPGLGFILSNIVLHGTLLQPKTM
jgi:4-hydroxybenzoate polyprenyltransferase